MSLKAAIFTRGYCTDRMEHGQGNIRRWGVNSREQRIISRFSRAKTEQCNHGTHKKERGK